MHYTRPLFFGAVLEKAMRSQGGFGMITLAVVASSLEVAPALFVNRPLNTPNDFNPYADRYDEVLNEALGASGEDRDYFANGRIRALAGILPLVGNRPRQIMDFGCGTGSSIPLLMEILGGTSAIGIDPSSRSLDVARRTFGSEQIQFLPQDKYEPIEAVDLVYCNGVFHHIAPAQRAAALRFVFRSLRPEGIFSFWENNPWNPGARYVMAHCAFDRDAIMLTPSEARRILRSAGFAIVQTGFHFIFPRALKALRPIEKLLIPIPLGAQYHILCRKPG